MFQCQNTFEYFILPLGFLNKDKILGNNCFQMS